MDMQSLVAGCENNKQCGKSRAFQLNFLSRDDLDTAAKMLIIIDFFQNPRIYLSPKMLLQFSRNRPMLIRRKNV